MVETHRIAWGQFATKAPLLSLILKNRVTGKQAFEQRAACQWATIFSHRAEFDDRRIRRVVPDTEEQAECSDDIVLNRIHSLIDIRHAIRSAGNFCELNDGFGLHLLNVGKECLSIQQIDFPEVNTDPEMLVGCLDSIGHRLNWCH